LRRDGTRSSITISQLPPFSSHPGKNDLHIRIPAAFPCDVRMITGAEKRRDCRGIKGLHMTSFPPAFWQTGRKSGLFFNRIKKDGFTGFSGSVNWKRSPDRAYFFLPVQLRSMVPMIA
jgi:hypothetical protein